MKTKIAEDETFKKLFKVARLYLNRAHSPYSHVKVAAAVLMKDGRVFGGCNVENASFGATICAERVAITKAVSEGSRKIKAILILTNQKSIWPPCGICRQVMAEFAPPEAVVYTANLKRKFQKTKFSELFPGAFDGGFLLSQKA